MTKDFRHIGRQSEQDAPSAEPMPPSAAALAANQRLILRIVQASAFAFLLAGVWLLSGQPSPLPREVSFYVGLALVATALGDVVAIRLLRRTWRGKDPG